MVTPPTRAVLLLVILLCAVSTSIAILAAQPSIVAIVPAHDAAHVGWARWVIDELQDKQYSSSGTDAFGQDMPVDTGCVCDQSGNPELTTIARSSANCHIVAAQRAVRGLAAFHPLINGIKRGQAPAAQSPFLALLSSLATPAVKQRIAALRLGERARNMSTAVVQSAPNTIVLATAAQ